MKNFDILQEIPKCDTSLTNAAGNTLPIDTTA